MGNTCSSQKELRFLTGARIYLRPFTAHDINDRYLSWFNDADVCQGNSHHVFPYTAENAQGYLESIRHSQKHLVLAIVRNEDDLHIGNVTLSNISLVNRTAELTLMIGEVTTWGKGYGKEATRLIFDHGFFTLNLHRIRGGAFETNIGACKMMEFVGMVKEGRRRQEVYKNGRYLDVIEFGVLKDEYVSRFHNGSKKNGSH